MKESLEKLCQEIQDAVTWQGEASILPNGRYAVVCTFSARLVAELRGGEVYGYLSDDEAFVGEGGHDFALIQNRYLVDWWNRYVMGDTEQAVFDLEDPKDAEIVARIYPKRESWELVPPEPLITMA